MNNLNGYKKDITSQWGEDGIISEIFNRIEPTNKVCIEFGAGPGLEGSNVWNLINNLGWRGLLIDPEKSRIDQWKNIVKGQNVEILNQFVEISGENSIDQILKRLSFPSDPDILSIDIDSNDYHIFKSLEGRPRVLLIEHNPTVPPHLELVQDPEEKDCYGTSAKSILMLAHDKGYRLVAATGTNSIFVREEDFSKLKIEEPKLEDVFDTSFLSYVISTYNGSNFITNKGQTQPSYSWFYDIYNLNLTKKVFHSISIGLSRNNLSSPTLSKKMLPVKIFVNKKESNYNVFRFGLKVIVIFLSLIKKFIYRSPLAKGVLVLRGSIKKMVPKNLVKYLRKEQELIKWKINGRPVPPPELVKQGMVKKTAKKYNLKTLVETGTAGGEMIKATKNTFDKIFSIELSERLFKDAQKTFQKDKHVNLIQGDSGEKLVEVTKQIEEPALFWLDAHYSGEGTALGNIETPIIKELRTIFSKNNNRDVILIDDARCFDGTHDYPTIQEIKDLVSTHDNFLLRIENDIIVIEPNK